MTQDNSTNQYESCLLAFLDILGFEDKVINCRDNKTLLALIDSLSMCCSLSSGNKKETSIDGFVPIMGRSFSDAIVFFVKIKPRHIPHLFLVIRYLQDRLWEKGLCLRGAITMGNMYWPKSLSNITIGPALIKAYKLEKKVAVYPRIVICNKVHEYIDAKRINAYPYSQQQRGVELQSLILQDNDGVFFLDLLSKKINRIKNETLCQDNIQEGTFSIKWNGDESNHSTMCDNVQQMIDENINSEDDKIRQKYEWLQYYLKKSVAG